MDKQLYVHGFLLEIFVHPEWRNAVVLPSSPDTIYRFSYNGKVVLTFLGSHWIEGIEQDLDSFAYWLGYHNPLLLHMVNLPIVAHSQFILGLQDKQGDIDL